jgi:ribosomal protein S18 acetylase RimI-like enzyme
VTAPVEVLDWDSEHFGVRIGRVPSGRLDAQSAGAVLAAAEEAQVACLYLLAAADDQDTVRAAEDAGFRLTDVRLTLDRPASADVLAHPDVRAAVPGDVGALAPIAADAHTDSRFFADPRFDRAAAARLYERWIEASVAGDFADLAFTALADGAPCGYITGRSGDEASIGLLGVGAAARGRGLGPQLVAAFVAAAARAGAERVSVVTQGRNVQAQRLYQRAGFRTARVELWYHRWA